MVKTVRDHYADHLGPVYTWMVGDMDVALSRSAVELDALQLPTKVGGGHQFSRASRSYLPWRNKGSVDHPKPCRTFPRKLVLR
jgi:hypothetical protein